MDLVLTTTPESQNNEKVKTLLCLTEHFVIYQKTNLTY